MCARGNEKKRERETYIERRNPNAEMLTIAVID
jgi:hypothetical protein